MGDTIFFDVVCCEQNWHQQKKKKKKKDTNKKYVNCWCSFLKVILQFPLFSAVVCLSIYSSETISVRFAAIGVSVVERLHLLTSSQLVSGLLFPQQLSAVMEQVTWQ